MTGLIHTRKGSFIFRDDHAHDPGIWAWNIHDPHIHWRLTTHKWQSMPKGIIVYFDIDNPPATVSYQPIIG